MLFMGTVGMVFSDVHFSTLLPFFSARKEGDFFYF